MSNFIRHVMYPENYNGERLEGVLDRDCTCAKRAQEIVLENYCDQELLVRVEKVIEYRKNQRFQFSEKWPEVFYVRTYCIRHDIKEKRLDGI